MKLNWKVLGLTFCFVMIGLAQASTPFKDDWTQTFYTDDSSVYLTLYPDGFKQLVRVNA